MSVRPHPRATRRTAPVEVLRGLAVLAEPPSPEHRRLAEALGLSEAPTPAHYADVFLFQLYPYASVHLGPEGMMGGEAGARVAGFWQKRMIGASDDRNIFSKPLRTTAERRQFARNRFRRNAKYSCR